MSGFQVGLGFAKAAAMGALSALLMAFPASLTARESQEPIRIAVLWAEGLEDHGNLIEAALSGEESIAVVDRSSLADLVREFELGRTAMTEGGLSQLRLLKADGILVVEAIGQAKEESARIAFRLVSVESGAVVAAYATPEGKVMEASPDTAAVIVSRFLAPAENLRNEDTLSVPISILNIRPSGVSPSPELIRLQKETASLIGPRLAAEPGIFVLERRRLGDLEFEKVFTGEASEEFWTGAWLLDGEVKEEAALGRFRFV